MEANDLVKYVKFEDEISTALKTLTKMKEYYLI